MGVDELKVQPKATEEGEGAEPKTPQEQADATKAEGEGEFENEFIVGAFNFERDIVGDMELMKYGNYVKAEEEAMDPEVYESLLKAGGKGRVEGSKEHVFTGGLTINESEKYLVVYDAFEKNFLLFVDPESLPNEDEKVHQMVERYLKPGYEEIGEEDADPNYDRVKEFLEKNLDDKEPRSASATLPSNPSEMYVLVQSEGEEPRLFRGEVA